MKILLYSLIFAPDVCSNAYVFSDLAKELKRQGHEVSVITTTPHYDEKNALEKRKSLLQGKKNWYMTSDYDGIPVYHIVVALCKGGAVQRLKTYYRFLKFSTKITKFENIEADVVLSQTPPFFIGLGANKLSKKLNAKSVLIYQDIFIESMTQKGKLKWPASTICKYLENKQLKKVDALSTISQDMLEVLKKKKYKGKIAIIPNFVQTSLYHPIEDNFREKYGLQKGDFVISYVGNLGNAQDLTPLFELAKQDKNVRILIAGNGVKEKIYKDVILNNQLDNVQFLGFVSREETCEINATSDICMVMLAKHVLATSFPSKTYTIMGMGKPIFVTCGENSTVGKFVEENKIGFSCNVEDIELFINKIQELKNKNDILEAYANNALKIVAEQYCESVVAEKYIYLMQGLLK